MADSSSGAAVICRGGLVAAPGDGGTPAATWPHLYLGAHGVHRRGRRRADGGLARQQCTRSGYTLGRPVCVHLPDDNVRGTACGPGGCGVVERFGAPCRHTGGDAVAAPALLWAGDGTDDVRAEQTGASWRLAAGRGYIS